VANQKDTSPEELLTRREACVRLRVGSSTYKKLVARKQIIEVHIGPRLRRLPASEVTRFIATRRDEAGQ
jgi:excisionase family DNA binding protein